MTLPYLGELLSVLAAFAWAFAVVLFRLSGRTMAPFAFNFFKNTVGLVLFLITIAILRQELFRSAAPIDYLRLILSGVIGLAIADTIFLRSLNVVGAGLSQVVGCLYTPFVILFSLAFLSERLSVGDVVGAALILSGVFMSARHKPPAGTSRRDLTRGVALGASAFAMMALGVVLAKPALDDAPILWATTVRLLAGVVTLALISLTPRRRRAVWSAMRPSGAWKTAVPAAVVGTYIAMLLWLAGIKYTQATTASILNQSSAIFVLPLAALVLGEPITRTKLAAVALAVSGVILVTLA